MKFYSVPSDLFRQTRLRMATEILHHMCSDSAHYRAFSVEAMVVLAYKFVDELLKQANKEYE